VIVAVVDGGVDVDHEDLKDVIWTNSAETAGNKADDDKNGYADDVHGWDFIGSAKGDVRYDNMELTRLVKRYWLKFAYTDPAKLNSAELKVYQEQKKLEQDLNKEVQEARGNLENVTAFRKALDIFEQHINNHNPSITDLVNFRPSSPFDDQVRSYLFKELQKLKIIRSSKEKRWRKAISKLMIGLITT
jgi:subtilisin family serine protease